MLYDKHDGKKEEDDDDDYDDDYYYDIYDVGSRW